MMKSAEIVQALDQLHVTLRKQNEVQEVTISALRSLTKMLLHAASSINTLNAELKNDSDEVKFADGARRPGVIN